MSESYAEGVGGGGYNPNVTAGSSGSTSEGSKKRRPEILEKSFFGVAPSDDFTREVAHWILDWTMNRDNDNIEIEAKVGLLVDPQTGYRVELPVRSDAILVDSSGFRFEANMTMQQHQRCNQILNDRVGEQAASGYEGAPSQYRHERETDRFFPDYADPGNRNSKIRVTTDDKTNQVSKCIRKTRIANMDVFCPNRPFDFRISVNTEENVDLPQDQNFVGERKKDRLSYKHQMFQIDLTKVQSKDRESHELEIEVADNPKFMKEAEKYVNTVPNSYLDVVQVFLNNIRLLVRNAGDPQ